MKDTRLLLIFPAAFAATALLALLFLSIHNGSILVLSPQVVAFAQSDDLPGTLQAASTTWLVECADCPRQFTESSDRMLRLDSQGRPHLAYGRDHLYYAWYDGTGWKSEIVDRSFLVGTYASLALDAGDNPHISYYDAYNTKIKYASYDGSGWHIQTLGDAGAGMTSLALDASGSPHISYWQGDRLKYAYRDASGWHFEEADSANQTGQRSSLALDNNGQPHISYWDAANKDLKYAHRQGGSWSTQTVDSQHTSGEYSSIAVGAAGRPQISYSYSYDGIPPNRDLRHAYWDGSTWITGTVDAAGSAGTYNSIALDASGTPHISHYDGSSLRYAFKDGADWTTTTIDSSGNVGAYSSIAVDSDGWAHIGYYQSVDFNFGQNIRYIRSDVSGWQSQLVDTGGVVGAYSSLALDKDGYAHISYQDVTYEDLKYAYQDQTGWHVQTLDWAGDVGRCTSLALAVDGNPHISYHDFSNQKLKYAYRDASGWHRTVIDASATAGCQASLALDSKGYAQVSYFDVSTKNIKAAAWDGSAWQYSIVDNAGDGSVDSSLALDSSDVPHISYLYAPTADLRYAYLDGSEWLTETVDAAGSVGWDSSLALDGAGRPDIAYRDDSNDDLKYAAYNGSGWAVEVVDAYGDTGRNPSLAIGQDGVARISYSGDFCPVGSCGRLKYAELTASGWVTQTIALPGSNYGFDASLSLLPGDQPRISFYDAATGDLKYAQTPITLTNVILDGPGTGTVGSVYTFTASILPPYATLPVTYTWGADDQLPEVGVSGRTDSISYSWDTPGSKQITLSASNLYSLVTTTHPITILDVAISGLAAANDSPTHPGEPTTLSASVQAGTNVAYTWDFGDGEMGSSTPVTHTYPAAGSYTATVTASNSAGSMQASTLVLVGWWVYLPIIPDGE